MHRLLKSNSVIIKRSRTGKGLIAKRTFFPDETILPINGAIVHFTYVNEKGGTFQDNTFRFNKNYYLSSRGKFGDYLNHSCAPNAKIRKAGRTLYLVASTSISKGSEIVIDYSTILARDDEWVMKCHCQSSDCRHLIKKFSKLPPGVLKEYKKKRLIPSYILNIK